MNATELRKAFIQSIYKTLDGVVSPTPFLQIVEGNPTELNFLNGKGRLPKKDATEITMLDLDTAALFFDDIHLLDQGVTGIGKSYTSDALHDAVYGPDGHYTIRLSGGLMGSSALEPFTVPVMENGMPKIRIDPENCQRFGAVFIDEINRGDSQEVLQVVDGVINLNGQRERLRLPIPGTARYKALKIFAAMNPADAEHSSAREIDIAVENRFLKFHFPNGVSEAASSQLEKSYPDDLHERLWSEFRRLTGLEGGWRALYPIITDPAATPSKLNGVCKEFIDVIVGYAGSNPSETFDRNIEIITSAGITPHLTLRQDNELEKIIHAQANLKHGFVRRDLRKIKDLSLLVAFIKSMKSGTYEPSVSLNDVVSGTGIVLEGKIVTGTKNGALMAVVNDAKNAYEQLLTEIQIGKGYGLREFVYAAAKDAGNASGFDWYINTLVQNMNKVNVAATGPAMSVIKSRMLADLAVLKHFSEEHKDAITEALKAENPVDAIEQIYLANKHKASLYEHRLEPILR